MLPIETERLYLRRFSMGDVGDIYSFAADPDISPHLHGFPGKTIDEIQDYIRQQNCFQPGQPEICFDLAIHLISENKLIGLVTLVSHASRQGEVGYALNQAYQRKGYATEAVRAILGYGFSSLGMHRIFAKTDRQNISSWMLLERVGMRREAIYLHDHQDHGEWHDTFVYAILAEEWVECCHSILH